MITDQETYKLKKTVLEEITQIYTELLKKDSISEQEADDILKEIEEDIAYEYNPEPFTQKVKEFCKKHPQFKQVEKKLRLKRNEILQNIGQECIENLMDQNTEKWEQLLDSLNEVDEERLDAWFNQLEPDNKLKLLNKLFTKA